ncbi:uncharacterized protein [Watersipora subatra]|uniref:uncharacterized protein n=1 Tax=Watersipora subatra TaxID=2589382 RepID=UPI00355C5984
MAVSAEESDNAFHSYTFLAADICFNYQECDLSPDRFIENYCQRKRNGGGDVAVVIYPWKGDCGHALVVFDGEFCSPDVIETLEYKKKAPILKVTKYIDSECFGLVKTSISPGLLKNLLTRITIDKLVAKLDYETGLRPSYNPETQRLGIEGFLFQIKLAEDMLKRLEQELLKK